MSAPRRWPGARAVQRRETATTCCRHVSPSRLRRGRARRRPAPAALLAEWVQTDWQRVERRRMARLRGQRAGVQLRSTTDRGARVARPPAADRGVRRTSGDIETHGGLRNVGRHGNRSGPPARRDQRCGRTAWSGRSTRARSHRDASAAIIAWAERTGAHQPSGMAGTCTWGAERQEPGVAAFR